MPSKTISFDRAPSARGGGPPSIDVGSFDGDDAMSDFGTIHTKTTNHSGGSSTERRRRNNGGIDPLKHPKLAQKEQRAVACSKFTMIAVLVLAVTSMATATYLLVSRNEQNDFEVQFENYASEVIAVSTEHVVNTFGTIEAFANTISSYAKDAGKVWPNVTVPDYTSRAQRVGNLASSARLVTMAPLVNGGSERLEFEEYARQNIYQQIQEDIDYQGLNATAEEVPGIPPEITYFNLTQKARLPEDTDGPYLVNWQRMPFEIEKGRVFVMNNMLRIPTIRSAVAAANITHLPTIAFLEALLGVESQVIQPIFEDVVPSHDTDGIAKRKMVGAIWVVMDWGNYFQNLLRDGADGIILVMKSSCGFETTYKINGLEAEFLGLEDLHDPAYDEYEIRADFFNLNNDESREIPETICVDDLTLHIYPSDELKESFMTKNPMIYTIIVVSIFAFTALVFVFYDYFVAARQKKVMNRVMTQDRLVSNLFPASFRDRLYKLNGGLDGNSDTQSVISASSNSNWSGSKRGGFYLDSKDVVDSGAYSSKPLADLFLETTVLFADISGFTAWSSAREPNQVFALLENIYGAFDKLSHRHKVFKVETIGDCYVAVTGVPDPQADHAVAMAKFARACMDKMKDLTKKLEVKLGPDTGDLELRIGIHSGQVTAGVLRGERSRFQLFGDTVNTASRMETTGMRSKIQLSSDTAELMKKQGRSKWVVERDERIPVHGKGKMKTYWLETKVDTKQRELKAKRQMALEGMEEQAPTNVEDTEGDFDDSLVLEEVLEDEDEDFDPATHMSKTERLVEWNVRMLSDLLKQIIASRGNLKTKPKKLAQAEQLLMAASANATVLEEFKEIITLPKVTSKDLQQRLDPHAIRLDPEVVSQLRQLLIHVASFYKPNAFHNFEHASHVTASVMKLLSRIVTTDTTSTSTSPVENFDLVDLAGHSYGITSDPLTQFAVVFSAIIHDAEHPGVPNATLIKEGAPMANKYKQKSIAEQNSVDIVWKLLMQPEFAALRSVIYSNEDELKRFRQLVVNTVMATDICDKELGALRKARWNTAFSEDTKDNDASLTINRKATIVIEHLIQASDVSHTMQHWKVYLHWNKCFFMECYGGYKAGRADTDPSTNWYKGEIGFFDFYVIPLAKKLESCGVFGVSSHEYLNYAEANREEWIEKGEDIVKGYIAEFNALSKKV